MAPPGAPPPEVDWEQLDKRKFLQNGVVLFTSVTTALYPLTVIKTRQQADRLPSDGMLSAVRKLARAEGLRGLYRGYSTVVVGTLPIRGLYLSVLEVTKARCRTWEAPAALPEALRTGAADFVAGATASCVTQCLVIPVDVVSQRLMVQGSLRTGSAQPDVVYRNGWAAARGIVKTEGMAGLYRGAGASLAIFVPSSGLWWGAYGAARQRRPRTLIADAAPACRRLPASAVVAPRCGPWSGRTASGVRRRAGANVRGRVRRRHLGAAYDAAGRRQDEAANCSLRARQAEAHGPLSGCAAAAGGGRVRLHARRGAARFVRHGASLARAARRRVLTEPLRSRKQLWGTCMVSAFELLKRMSVREGSGDAETA